ncbi:hypothetical protein pb186bvf_007293 [Paramecium bursaria]
MLQSNKIKHYQIQRNIGKTSFSSVELSYDTKTKKFVAIKKIAKDNPNCVDQDFHKKEITIYSTIKQKILQEETTDDDKKYYQSLFPEFIEHIESDRFHYIVLEYCECNLGDYLKEQMENAKQNGNDKDKYFDQKHAQDIISEIALGMSMLHQHDFSHRDLKPQNILIKQNNREKFQEWGNVKIADFSLAAIGNKLLFETKVGTLGYMASEIRDQTVKDYCPQKSDMFSLGVVWYELLTGLFDYKEDFTKIKDDLKMTIDQDTKNLIKRMTQFDANLRINWSELLLIFSQKYQTDQKKSERFRRASLLYFKQKYVVYQDLDILIFEIKNQLHDDPNIDYYIYLIIKWMRYIGKDLSKEETPNKSRLIGLDLKYDQLYIAKFKELIEIDQREPQNWPELNFFKTQNFDKNIQILRKLIHNNQIDQSLKEKDLI